MLCPVDHESEQEAREERIEARYTELWTDLEYLSDTLCDLAELDYCRQHTSAFDGRTTPARLTGQHALSLLRDGKAEEFGRAVLEAMQRTVRATAEEDVRA